MFDHRGMNGDEFIKRVQRMGRQKDVPVKFEVHRGKGSHGRLWYGNRWTTVKDRRKQIGKGLLSAMCRQLGIEKGEL